MLDEMIRIKRREKGGSTKQAVPAAATAAETVTRVVNVRDGSLGG
jgi:hypothetical protein